MFDHDYFNLDQGQGNSNKAIGNMGDPKNKQKGMKLLKGFIRSQ